MDSVAVNGRSIMHYNGQDNYARFVRVAAKHGLSAKFQPRGTDPPIFDALVFQDPRAMMTFLYETDADPNAVDKSNVPLLQKAVVLSGDDDSYRLIEIIGMLLDNGCAALLRDEKHRSSIALHAVEFAPVQVVARLIESGWDYEAGLVENDNVRPVDAARAFGRIDVVALLLELKYGVCGGDKRDLLERALRDNECEDVDMILSTDAYLLTRYDSWRTCLLASSSAAARSVIETHVFLMRTLGEYTDRKFDEFHRSERVVAAAAREVEAFRRTILGAAECGRDYSISRPTVLDVLGSRNETNFGRYFKIPLLVDQLEKIAAGDTVYRDLIKQRVFEIRYAGKRGKLLNVASGMGVDLFDNRLNEPCLRNVLSFLNNAEIERFVTEDQKAFDNTDR